MERITDDKKMYHADTIWIEVYSPILAMFIARR